MNKIEYKKNNNVTFKQWKYNNSNYIAVVNLEREKEIFKIDLLDKFYIKKEFGLGTFKKNGTEIIFNLEPIDVIMIKYSKNFPEDSSDSSDSNNLLIIFIIIIIVIIFIAILFFIVKKYLMRKNETNNFAESVSKSIND